MNSSERFASIRAQQTIEMQSRSAEIAARLDWPRNRVLETQQQSLKEMLAFAQISSPYYRETLKGIDAGAFTLKDLQVLPIVTKDDVMNHWDEVVTDPRLKLDEVNRHLARVFSGEEENPYYLDEYYISATGGTTGNRGVFVWDREDAVIAPNLTYRMMKRFGDAQQKISGKPKHTAVICAGSFAHASRFLFSLTLDPQRRVEVLPANWPLDRMVDALNAYQPDQLIGYASIIQELCALAVDGVLDISPAYVSTNSEPLFDEARALAREAWNINIHNTWGSVDMGGVAAVEGEAFAGLTLAEDYYIFESVDDQYRAVDDPGLATRVLVTRLFNKTMPLIRYEMTDTLVLDSGVNPDAPGYRRVLEVKGRADDWFVYGAIKVHPMIFRGVLGQQHAISQYQVRQTVNGAEIYAITHEVLDKESVCQLLKRKLMEQGLKNAEIILKIVDELPRHAQTNKLKRFVPLV